MKFCNCRRILDIYSQGLLSFNLFVNAFVKLLVLMLFKFWNVLQFQSTVVVELRTVNIVIFDLFPDALLKH